MTDLIITISDLHIPYQHRDALAFVAAIKKKYWTKAKTKKVIFGGDELTWSAISYHEKDPTLYNSEQEYLQSLRDIKKWHKLFPKALVLESNHGSLVYRRQKTHGLPPGVFKSYNDILEIPAKDWQWVPQVTVDGIVFCHGKSNDVLKLSKAMGKSLVQFHYHEKMCVQYWDAGSDVKFAAQAGCLIDDTSAEFDYNKLNMLKPLIGTLVIYKGEPKLYRMILDKKGRWIGELR